MHTPTDRALAVARRMSPEERAMILNLFDNHAGSTDPAWAHLWVVPPSELDVALRLLEMQGY